MFSGAVKLQGARHPDERIRELIGKEEHFQRWIEHPSSSIVHHDAECCDEARSWFLALARSMEIGAHSRFDIKAPTWLSRLYKWGPSEWPIAWCEVARARVIDCGVFAALAREVFKAQGLEAHPAQAILSYNAACTAHWKDLWRNGGDRRRKKRERSEGGTFPWIGTEVVYHELCVLELPDGEAKVYDSTWGNWYLPQPRVGYGALLALRTDCPRILRWGNKTMSCGEWIDL